MNRLLLPAAGGGTPGSSTASYTPLQLGMALKSVKSAVMRNVVLVRVGGWVSVGVGGMWGQGEYGAGRSHRRGAGAVWGWTFTLQGAAHL